MNDRLASVLPLPASVRPMPGSLALGSRPSVTAGPGAGQAAAAVRRALASWPWPDDPGQARPDGRPGADPEVAVDLDPARPGEGYRLAIGTARIRITAGGAAGAFYAAQTLRQLLPDDAWRAAPVPVAPWSVPCAEIDDAPALAWRGAHLDVARHFFPKRELLTLIDSFAALRLNRLHLHLTDDQGWRIESRAYPALHEIGSHRPRSRISLSREQPAVYDETPHGGYYTLADLAEIAEYAAQRMMTVVPEIEVPGHATALLAAVPELAAGRGGLGPLKVAADWGILPNLISPLPETMRFLEAVLGELLDAIPTGYVHIGGDECVLDSWRADPRVDAYRVELGLASADEQHAHFLRQTADMLADRFGARAVVWDEGFASGSGTPRGRLRPDTVVTAWRGMDIARRAALAGHDVVAAPVFPTYFDYYQADDDREPLGIGGPVRAQDVAAFSPVPPDWPAAAAERLIGTQFQVWTEYIPDGRALEYMVFPRACAFAEVAWAGGPAAWSHGPGQPGDPALRDRVAAHLGRLDAAGVEYRPLGGPRPWQEGGAGPRRHRLGYPVAEVAARLGDMAAAPSS